MEEENRLSKIKKKKIWISVLIYALPMIIIFSIVLAAYWPGILVSDTLSQWHQVQTGIYNNWHPIFDTLFIKLCTLIWNTPGFALIVQILILSFSMAYTLSRLEKYYNVKKWYLVVVALLFALIPLNFNFAITLLKDIIYSAFVLLLTGFTFDIVNDKEWIKKWYNILILIINMFLITVFRHNGIILVALMLVTLFIILKGKRKIVLIMAAAWLVSYFALNSLVTVLFNVQKATYSNTYAPVSHLFADMLNNEEISFTDEEIQILKKYVDVDKLKETYDINNMDYSIACQNVDALKESGSEYLKLCINKCLENIWVPIKHYIQFTSYLYSPIPFKDSFYVGMFLETNLWVYDDVYPHLAQQTRIPEIYYPCLAAAKWYQTGTVGDITMRPAIWMYLSIASILFVCIKRKSKLLFIVILPSLYNTISLAPAMPVAMTRYVYATMLIGWIMIPWALYEVVTLVINKIKKRG